MACGDKFRNLVVTATGLSVGNPYDDVPSFTDFEEWKERARQLALTAQGFANALGQVESAVTPGSFPEWNRVNAMRATLVGHYDELPSAFLNFSPAENIASAIAVCLEATCVIETAEAAILKLGGTAPVIPGAPPPRKNDGLLSGAASTLGTLAVIGAVVVGAVFLSRRASG